MNRSPAFPKALLALLSGGALILLFPRFDLGALAFVALVPLLIGLEGERPVPAFGLGLLTGIVFYSVNLSWLTNAMALYGGLSWEVSVLVLVLLSLYLSLYIGAFSLLWVALRPPSGLGRIFFAPSLWVSLEYLRTSLLTGFPWAFLGYSQYKALPLIQVAAWTGVYGLSFLLVMVNVTVAFAFLHRRRWPTILLPASITILVMAGAWIAGEKALSSPKQGKTFPVAVLQGNIDQGVKWDRALQERTLEIYERLTRDVGQKKPRLIVWPETAIPTFLRWEPGILERVRRFAQASGAALLVGSLDLTDASPTRYYNSAFLISPGKAILEKYDKIHLVPFGEYIPLKRLLFFVEKLAQGVIGDFSPGSDDTVFSLPEGRFGVTISFEVYFPAQVRRSVRNGADFLVNITNDAWYGRTAAPFQHLAMVVFRAVENRVYLVRAANTGISAIIAPIGRIIAASEVFVEAALVADIRAKGKESFYTRYGDLFALTNLLLILAFIGSKFRPISKRFWRA